MVGPLKLGSYSSPPPPTSTPTGATCKFGDVYDAVGDEWWRHFPSFLTLAAPPCYLFLPLPRPPTLGFYCLSFSNSVVPNELHSMSNAPGEKRSEAIGTHFSRTPPPRAPSPRKTNGLPRYFMMDNTAVSHNPTLRTNDNCDCDLLLPASFASWRFFQSFRSLRTIWDELLSLIILTNLFTSCEVYCSFQVNFHFNFCGPSWFS